MAEENENGQLVCAITGNTGEPDDDDSDNLAPLPVGWVSIEIKRRSYNPDWVAIQEVKRRVKAALLAQSGVEKLSAVDEKIMDTQIRAQFFAIEEGTPKFVADVSETVIISDDPAAVEQLNAVRELLGLPPMPEAYFSESDEDALDDGSDDQDIDETVGEAEELQEEVSDE